MTTQATADTLLEGLTDPQRQAVLHTEGPLLILAAAGSGKTRVITHRIARLISIGVPAWQILAVTFTNKAAGEMRDRVATLFDAESARTRGLTISTFHALCARLLRRYAPQADLPGLRADFSIYDSADQLALAKRIIKDLQLSTSNFPPRSMLARISAAKNDLLDADAFRAGANDFYSGIAAKVYDGYQAALRAAHAVDFDDLLMLCVQMLRQRPEILAACNDRWRYLMIDEYQDTNHAQFTLASLMAGQGQPLPPGCGDTETIGPHFCVVGDPDQAIYGWRGADISNILEFEEHYPSTRVIALGENFRSTAPILAIADSLIRNNKLRRHKDLFTSRQGGDKVSVVHCQDERHEASLVADWIREQRDQQSLAWRDIAVFYRTNALSRVLEDALRVTGIPCVIARGTAFYQREEIKNALGYLRVVANQADSVSLERIINTPARGIGKASIKKVVELARSRDGSLWDALRESADPAISDSLGLAPRARAAITSFLALIDGWTASGTFLGSDVPASLPDLAQRIITESGLASHYKQLADAGKSETDLERLDNLDELISSAAQFADEYDPSSDPVQFDREQIEAGREPQTPPLLALLRAYLESVSLIADADTIDPAQGAVTLMTLHAAKGLEFTAVAMIGLEEGLLPHSRSNESDDAALEEERRLCFVGITRAMRHLLITSARYRAVRGISERTLPSRFLEELDDKHDPKNITVSDQADSFDSTDDSYHDDPPKWARAGTQTDTLGGSGRSEAARAFPVDSRVRHPQFGEGVVESVVGGANARVRVRFRHVGTKTLVLEYARLTRLA
ncbi:MAG: UvrD-helicase domain-containing protein [Planctomycetes bacterium]|nr:UvrD-helicase domain-containing protein [Planctomycetota bacterium]